MSLIYICASIGTGNVYRITTSQRGGAVTMNGNSDNKEINGKIKHIKTPEALHTSGKRCTP